MLLLRVSALLSTLIMVIVLLRMKVKLGLVMLSGAILMSLFGRLLPITVINTMVVSITNPETIKLMLIIIGITSLGHLLKVTGRLNEIIINLRNVISDVRILIALIPALVGLLAVPGGAIMSAPLIEQMGDEVGLNRDSLATANIIFRHIYTYTFPMSTGMVLISSISGVNPLEFLKFNIPIMIIAMPLAFYYIFWRIKPIKINENRTEPKMVLKLVISLLPFIIIITMGLVFKIYFPLAIFAGILYVIVFNRRNTGYLIAIKGRLIMAIKGVKWEVVLAIAGLMFFKDIVAATGFLNEISSSLVATGIPISVLAIIFPFIMGIIMGNNSAALGLSAPLFLSIIPSGINPIPYYTLIHIVSSTAYIISPFHLCLLLTIDYYKASYFNVLKQVAFICSWVVTFALIRFVLPI
jgi:hypothetical protein